MRLGRLLFMAALVLMPVGSWAESRLAGSCSFSDVSAAVASAVDGDVVVVPAGSSTWASTLTITKAITLQGAGSALSVITAADSGTAIMRVKPGSNKPVRVTGLGFVGGTNQVSIVGVLDGSYCLDQVRVDHCSFTNGGSNLVTTGWVEGLIDHNYFLNCNRAILVVGDNSAGWARSIAAGTSHALFIEDNTFKQTNAGGGGLNENVYHQEGARTVVRHNDFDGSEYTSYDYVPFDSHGNQNYYTGGAYDFRGQPLIEVYENTFRYHHSYRVCYFRGGSVLFHDNAFTTVTYSTEVELSEEEGWQTAFFSPLKTAWPAEDQINNSFFWNNTRNGSPIADVALGEPSDPTFIQRGRDYFMHAPEATGGRSTYTARAGGAETFTASGANAYYPYTPFQYPHPLQGGGSPMPVPPSRLRIQSP